MKQLGAKLLTLVLNCGCGPAVAVAAAVAAGGDRAGARGEAKTRRKGAHSGSRTRRGGGGCAGEGADWWGTAEPGSPEPDRVGGVRDGV